MSVISKANQANPPLPKRKRVDSLGNSHKRVWVKSGTSTMLLCKGLSEPAAKVLCENILDMVQKLGTKLECSFKITQ